MSDYLPEEVVLEILQTLPVKSLIRFRCVSKSWKSLITSSAFINSHLTRSLSLSFNKLIFRQRVDKLVPYLEYYKLIDDTIDSSSDQIQHIDFPLTCQFLFHFNLIGSVNGLFSLYEQERYILWNPSIRKYITLPKPCITVKTSSRNAFGFDPRNNDYKVVRIVFQDGTKTSEAAKIPVVEIYSLNEGSWRITRAGNSLLPGFSFVVWEPATSVNGAVHFLVKDMDNKSCPLVLSFDLGDEVFRAISMPNGAFSTSDYVRTSVIGGLLSLLCHDTLENNMKCCSIWVMKEYGVVDSWTKQFTVDCNGGLLLGLLKNGNILVETITPINSEISSYDPKSRQVKNLGICRRGFKIWVDNYMENLVLLDKPNDKVPKRRVSRKRKYTKSRQVKNLGICRRGFKIWVDNYMENLVLLDKPNDKVPKRRVSSLTLVSEEERRDKETSRELEKKMLHLEHDIAILKAKVMEISTLKLEMASLKSQALQVVQQLSNQVMIVTKTLSEKNKESCGKQKGIARSGPKSFAQISNVMAKSKRVPVEHADVYEKVYPTKDGAAVTPQAEENIARMRELLNEDGMRLQGELGGGILSSKDDAYARAIGLEHAGCVRGVGFGQTPLGRSATNLSRFTSTSPSSSGTAQRISELETSLREQIAQFKARHEEQLAQSKVRHEEQLSQAKARHKQQMAEVLTHMREMFAKLSSHMRDFNPS